MGNYVVVTTASRDSKPEAFRGATNGRAVVIDLRVPDLRFEPFAADNHRQGH
jgi:hypothetical protein